MSAQAKYKTEPMKLWNKVKEFKNKHFTEYHNAHKDGRLRFLGSTALSISQYTGFENSVIMGSEPFAANIAFYKDFGMKAMEICEKKGMTRELCGYSKCVWGAEFMDKNIMPNGTMIDGWGKPDFASAFSLAPCHCKWFQILCENAGVPMYLYDLPKAYPYNDENLINYMTGQMMANIEECEKAVGQPFIDELFIEGAKNEIKAYDMWTQIMLLNQAVPAPLDEKTMFSFIVPNLTRPYDPETYAFMKELRDEVQDRVDRGIAAVANEQFRIITDAIPPWPALELYRYLEKEYGGVVVGSPYVICLCGCWKFENDEGDLIPTPMPMDIGMPMTTREETVRALCWYRSHFSTETPYNIACGEVLHELTLKIAKQWNADGGMLHQNIGCTMQALGSLESRNAVAEAGIPCINYEGNDADVRDIDMTNMKRKFDIFFEANGVKRLTK